MLTGRRACQFNESRTGILSDRQASGLSHQFPDPRGGIGGDRFTMADAKDLGVPEIGKLLNRALVLRVVQRQTGPAAILAINRLCAPGSELAIEERWYPTTALEDLLHIPDGKVNDSRLYRALDQLSSWLCGQDSFERLEIVLMKVSGRPILVHRAFQWGRAAGIRLSP